MLGVEEVARFLRRNPDFFEQRPELLSELVPPSRAFGKQNGAPVVDFQRALNDRLREDVARLEQTHAVLVDTGRQNLVTQGRVHKCVLALLAARSFEQVIQVVTTDWAVLLDVDAVTLCVERPTRNSGNAGITRVPGWVGIHLLEPGTVSRLIGDGRRSVLQDNQRGHPSVFGNAAGLVSSSALVRLTVSRRTPSGLLALGSRNPDNFQPGQARELLCFLADVLTQEIRNWLEIADPA